MSTTEERQYINEESSVDNDAASLRIKKIKRVLKRCRAEKQEYLAGWQRAMADFQNYKKQQGAEREEFIKFANTSLLLRFLPVLDNLVLTCETMPENERESSWAKGVLSILRQFEGLLTVEGLEEIKVQTGDKFNPEIHEAIGETTGGGEPGTVAEVLRRGYKLHDKVIQVTRVKVIKQ